MLSGAVFVHQNRRVDDVPRGSRAHVGVDGTRITAKHNVCMWYVRSGPLAILVGYLSHVEISEVKGMSIPHPPTPVPECTTEQILALLLGAVPVQQYRAVGCMKYGTVIELT